MQKYMLAVRQLIKESKWLQWVAADLGIELPWPLVVQVDNKQVISFKYGTCPNSRLRGMIDLRWNWVKELRDDGICQVEKVCTRGNLADILTKCLSNVEFQRQVLQIQNAYNQGGNRSTKYS